MNANITKILGFDHYSEYKMPTSLNICAIVGTLFFLFFTNSILNWFSFSARLKIVIYLVMIFISMYLKGRNLIGLTKTNRRYTLVTLVLWIYLVTKNQYNAMGYLSTTLCSISLFLFLQWDPKLLRNVYKYLYRFLVVIAFFTIIVTILSAFNLLRILPHYELPPVENVHERGGITYYVYGLIVTYHSSYYEFTLQRGCGILAEPGHFSILLGIIWAIERLQRHRMNYIILLCGFLTLSPNFFIIFIFMEVWIMFIDKKYGKGIRRTLMAIGAGILIFLLLPTNLQDEVYYFIFDRNLVGMWEMFTSTTSLDDTFNERANATGLFYYENFLQSDEIITGTTISDINYQLSDYRGLLVTSGLIGIILVILQMILSTPRLKWKDKTPLLFILILVFLHRAWMFKLMYQSMLIFIGSNMLLLQYKEQKSKRSVAKG